VRARSPLLLLLFTTCLRAQLPFYTDDPSVTEKGKWHFEFFNEIDALQSPLYPNLRQNTANYKINYGLPHNLELDLDSPYLAIYRDLIASPRTSTGIGDTNLGVKWNFHNESPNSRIPALSASFYVEFPTGDSKNDLGSGLADYWLNIIYQKHLTEKIRVTANTGVLFAGNTSTGVVGITTTRGRVYTGGLSLLREFNPRWTLGVEAYGGYAPDAGIPRSQLQFMGGGVVQIRKGFGFVFGLLGGKYIGSPRIGGQVGFSVDFPDIVQH